MKTVFKTVEATFEGAIGGYRTVGNEPKPTGSSKDDDEEDDEDDEDGKKEAEEKKKQEEAEEKKKEAEEAKEKAEEAKEKAQEEAEKKAALEKAKEEKEEEEKEQEEAAKKKAAAEADKSRSEAAKETTAKESTTAQPTRTRAQVTSSNDPSSVPTVISGPAESQSIESILAKATGAASASTTIDEVADMSGSSSLPSSTSAPEASGTSAGTKAGIAFGVLGGLLVMGLLVFFVFSKRRKQAEMERLENDDEKLHGPMVGGGGAPMAAAAAVRRSMSPEPFEPDTASVRTDAKAPRVSLRPVTQFLPNWNGLDNQKRTSKGAALALAVPVSTSPTTNGPLSPRTPGGSAWERPSTAQSIDPANPFGTQAERVPSPVQEETASALRASPSPMSEKSTIAVGAAAVFPAATAPVSPISPSEGPLTAAGAASVARKTSIRKDGPPQLDLTLPNAPMAAVPASPAGTDYSNTSAVTGAPESPSGGAAAIAAAGGPANSAVHRVQLDFKPTMDDELELKAGDLVRLLHEYDDGWVSLLPVVTVCLNHTNHHPGALHST